MTTNPTGNPSGNPPRHWFTTTHWSVVLAAGGSSSPDADAALETLCRTYWFPLYTYARKSGQRPEDAEDLVQQFFARCLRRGQFAQADPARGRFRTFLLTSLKHFLINEWVRGQARRRGGDIDFVSWEEWNPEESYRLEPADELTPEKAYERRWVLTVLEEVLRKLRQEMNEAGKGAQFEQLKEYLWGEHNTATYAQMADRLGMKEGAVKVTVHRLRAHCRKLLRKQIAEIVADPAEIDDELRHLMSVLSE